MGSQKEELNKMNNNQEKNKIMDNCILEMKQKCDMNISSNLIEIDKFLRLVIKTIPFKTTIKKLKKYYVFNAYKYKFNHIKSKDGNKQVILYFKGSSVGSFSYIELHEKKRYVNK